MNITGKIHEIGEEQQVTDTFKKRDFVIQYAENPEYVEYIKFELTQDRTDLTKKFKAGEDVTVDFNLRGRPFTNKQGVTTYFNSLVAWKIAAAEGGQEQTPEYAGASNPANDEDDLPF